MNKYTNQKNENKLDSLLAQRKAPLSEDGLQKALQDLTLYMSGDIYYFGALFPKEEKVEAETLTCGEIEKADMMEGTDGERYFPVFSSIEKLKEWKPKLQKDEFYYVFNKQDLLTFLEFNQKVAAIVMNPLKDDLLLHRMLLQNLIQVDKDELPRLTR